MPSQRRALLQALSTLPGMGRSSRLALDVDGCTAMRHLTLIGSATAAPAQASANGSSIDLAAFTTATSTAAAGWDFATVFKIPDHH